MAPATTQLLQPQPDADIERQQTRVLHIRVRQPRAEQYFFLMKRERANLKAKRDAQQPENMCK